MKTTIRIDDELHRAAERHAAETGRSLSAVIEDALHAALSRAGKPVRRKRRVVLPVFRGGGGVRPGVDLDNSAALLDIMDEHDGYR